MSSPRTWHSKGMVLRIKSEKNQLDPKQEDLNAMLGSLNFVKWAMGSR